MQQKNDIKEYIQSLLSSKRMGNQVVYHTVLPNHPAQVSKPEKPWPQIIDRMIHSAGIRDLYRHQSDAIDFIRSGRHLVVATPTASGKTMIYNLPVVENILKNQNPQQYLKDINFDKEVKSIKIYLLKNLKKLKNEIIRGKSSPIQGNQSTTLNKINSSKVIPMYSLPGITGLILGIDSNLLSFANMY